MPEVFIRMNADTAMGAVTLLVGDLDGMTRYYRDVVTLEVLSADGDTVTLGRCERSLPLFAKLNPAPKVRAISLGAGIHSWGWTDDKLPQGIVPVVAKLWHDAIMNGFFIK